MALLRDVVRVELASLFACLALTVAWKILRGILRPAGWRVFRSQFGGGMAGLLRLQMLALSVVFAGSYLAGSLRSAGSGALPAIPNYALVLLGSSQAAFLGAAVWCRMRLFGALRNE
jgi:hypothetical protein